MDNRTEQETGDLRQSQREQTLSLIKVALEGYKINEQQAGLIAEVWKEKNRLFDLLRNPEDLPFHNEDHTNRVTQLTAQALQCAKISGVNISDKEAVALIIGAVAHDLGYLKEENGQVVVNHTNDLGGHEERSKIKLKAIAQGGEIDLALQYIDWTKLSKNVPEGIGFTQEKGLILKYTDLVEGISAGSRGQYEQRMEGLWKEFELANSHGFESVQHLKGSQTKNGKIFIDMVALQTEPLLKLYEANNINTGIRQAIINNQHYCKSIRNSL